MSDADRLRAAADQCDAWAADTKAANSALLTSWKIDAATAALLRAVADESEVCWCGPEYTERGLSRPGCPAHDVMVASRDAALVLADAILEVAEPRIGDVR